MIILQRCVGSLDLCLHTCDLFCVPNDLLKLLTCISDHGLNG